LDFLSELLSTPTKNSVGLIEINGESLFEGVRIDNLSKEGYLSIDKDLWSELNRNHPKQKIIFALSKAIEHYELKNPFLETLEEKAEEDFMRLQSLSIDGLLKQGLCAGRVDSTKYLLGDKYLSNERVGRASSNYFQLNNRLKCSYFNLPSPLECWTVQKWREYFLRALWSLKYDKVGTKELRSAISLRGYVAAQFPPAIAKFFYDKFKAKKVLDFSAGWGDRLCGFYASNAEEYVGLDPNPTLHPAYQQQIDLYNKYTNSKVVRLIQSPAEDFDFSEYTEYFDMIFTSPPYFNRERYAADGTQSWVRYGTLDVWLEQFLFKTISSTWKTLSPGGFYIINIADLWDKQKKSYDKICEPMNDYISTLAGAQPLGCVNIQLSSRTNKLETRGIQVEPCWVWRKV
jgi:hypothetical protein